MRRKSFFDRIMCKHAFIVFDRNIHGDEINHANGRSVWSCCFCGKSRVEKELYEPKGNPLYKLL